MPLFLLAYSSLWTPPQDTMGLHKSVEATALLGRTCTNAPPPSQAQGPPNQTTTFSQPPWPLLRSQREAHLRLQLGRTAHVSGH